jgi:pyruvate,water dikinase
MTDLTARRAPSPRTAIEDDGSAEPATAVSVEPAAVPATRRAPAVAERRLLLEAAHLRAGPGEGGR